jgi:hypothetical protein
MMGRVRSGVGALAGQKMTATFNVTFGEINCEAGPDGQKFIDKACLADFWEQVGSGSRRGVYVFGIRAGKGWKPLYVGQATKQTFKTRIGQHVGTNGDFNKMLSAIKKGTPVLFLIGRVGKGRRSRGAIDALELDFINYAFGRNKNLHNDRRIKKPQYAIEGFGSRGKPQANVSNLKLMVGY